MLKKVLGVHALIGEKRQNKKWNGGLRARCQKKRQTQFGPPDLGGEAK